MEKRTNRITRSALVATLFVSSLLSISATPAHATNNYEALAGNITAIARAGGSVEASVVTALPNNEMQTTDSVILLDGCSRVLAINSNPTIVSSNSKSYADYRLSIQQSNMSCIPSQGISTPNGVISYNYSFLYAIVLSGTLPALGNSINPWNSGGLVFSTNVYFAGQPARLDFGPSQSDPFKNQINGSRPYAANFYDANGVPTLLLDSESLIAAPSGSIALQSSGSSTTINTVGQIGVIDRSSLDSNLNYGIALTQPLSGQGSISFIPTGSNLSITPQSVVIPNSPSRSDLYPVVAGTDNNYVVAGGSDGNLYAWGPGIPQPIRMPLASGCAVKQIVNLTILDTCGYVWSLNSNFFPLGSSRSGQLILQRIPILGASTAGVKQMSGSGGIYLLNDNSIVQQSTNQYSFGANSIDLTAMGSDVPTAIRTAATQNPSIIILGASGKLYSVLDNSVGEAGQGVNNGTVPLGQIRFGSEPDTVTVRSFDASAGSVVALLSDNTLWGWGDNRYGYAGKDPSVISQLTSPALIPLPSGFTPNLLSSEYGVSKFRIYGVNQAGQQANYTFQNGIWLLSAVNVIHDYSSTSTLNPQFFVDSTGAIFNPYVIGNCGDPTTSRVSSVGQFGPAYSYDALVTGTTFLQEGNSVTTVDGSSVNEIAGHSFALQMSGIHTRCYPSASQLTVMWDLDGNGNYTTPATLIQANTGYSVYQATLNYPNAGRYKVGLQVVTPSGGRFSAVTTIGVDAVSPGTIPLFDTRTTQVSNSSTHVLAIGSDGLVYSWGDNTCDQLGIPKATYSSINIPTLVNITDSNTAQTVTAGFLSSYLVDSAGGVYAWGESPGPNGEYAGMTPTYISELANTPVRDIASGIGSTNYCQGNDVSNAINYGPSYSTQTVALTTTGKLLTWGTTMPVTTLPGSAGLTFKQISSSNGVLYALDTTGNLWKWPSTGAIMQISGIAGVSKLRAGLGSVVAILGNGSIQAEYGGGNFGAVSFPNNVNLSDIQSGPGTQLLGISTDGTLYQTSLSYANQNGTPTLTASTWYPVTQQTSVSQSDLPQTQSKSDYFISFASNRLAAINSWWGYQGNCGIQYGNFSRVISTGQFGTTYNPDTISVGSLTATVGTNAAVNIAPGGLLAAAGGTSIVLRAQNLSSRCYGSNLAITADSTGTGTFSPISLSNENGTYSYVITATAPTSGRLPIAIRARASSGLTLSFNVNIASYATTEYQNITARNQPFYTSDSFGLAVGSDGYAYGWANDKKFNFMLNSTPPFASASPTKVIINGNPRFNDIAGARSQNSDDYGVIAADSTGKVWAWGSSANADLPITAAAAGSTPITPTPIAGLSNINIKRLTVSSTGNAIAALASTGVVYIWNQRTRTPVPVVALAGLNIVDIQITDQNLFALTSTGDLFSSGAGYSGWIESLNCASQPGDADLSDASQACFPIRKVTADPIANFTTFDRNRGGFSGVLAVSMSGKLYLWGSFVDSFNSTPVQISLPNSLVPARAGNAYLLPQVIATDGTWLSLTQLVNGSLALVPTEQVRPGLQGSLQNIVGFSAGDGGGLKLSDGALYTNIYSTAGSCSTDQPWFNRVMSDGQFGAAYHTDSIEISANGPQLFRPGISTPISLTATSVCNGGLGIVFDHKILGESSFSGSTAGTPNYNQSSSTSTFNFTPSTNGANWITFRATNANGISGTYQFEADVVPAPPAGRLMGVSINEGARYTNSRNVNIDLVWPDGTLVAYVSNDGGFVPGTYSSVPLQAQIPWVLPPQAAVPLPAIVYARFGDANATTYFDDIIMDSLAPILTYASATPNP